MKHEHSAGAVLYTLMGGEPHFVIVMEKSGYFGFPKGHLEGDETEEQAALREIFEETHINAELDTNFKITDEYMKAKRIRKSVTYFAAYFENQNASNKAKEVLGVYTLPYDKAMAKLSFESSREILRSFRQYFESKKSN